MEQLAGFLKGIDKNLIGVLLTSLIAFLSWLVKGLIETPLNNSKEIFYKFLERRIEILSDLKIRLSLIAYFPNKEGNEFKNQVQEILLKDGKGAYLDNNILQSILKISINENSDEKLILQTIDLIDNNLAIQIGKIRESNNFFTKYSNINPLKRIVGYCLLVFYYALAIGFIIFLIGFFLYAFLFFNMWFKLIFAIMAVLIFYSLNKWINN